MNQTERRIFLLKKLIGEDKRYERLEIPRDSDKQKELLRALMNMRAPKPADSEFIKIQDEYLSEAISEKGVTDADSFDEICDGICLWQGDITTLKCDAIVNAANSEMTGCYYPNHACIDNTIHTYAGVQLRLLCDEIMEKQGHLEMVGGAKITPAFNLPSKYVIHTVGPFISGEPEAKDFELLSACYKSCLSLAGENGIKSLAFCCISTGEFHFPNDLAAEVAVKSVRDFKKKDNRVSKVIFNVFKDDDKKIYEKLLG